MPPGQFGAPPPPPRPPRMGILKSPSAIRTAALNASGLGAGYFYLRQWPFFAGALIVTVGLLVTAAIIGAADNLLLWVPIFLVWFAAAAVHGLFAGRARDERALTRGEQLPKNPMPFLAAGGLAVAVAASLLSVWQVGEWQLRVANAAHARGDCDSAITTYERVGGGFQLSFSPSLMQRSRDGIAACELLQTAQADVDNEEYEQALDSYATYFGHHAAEWEDTDGEVADIHLSFADGLKQDAVDGYTGVVNDEYRENLQRAHEIYTVIPRDYDGTAAAGEVPGALVDLYDVGTSDYADELWCTAHEQIAVFEGLAWDAAPEVTERIDAEYPESARQCGWAEVDGGDATTAETMTDFLTAEYPDYEADDVEDLVRHVGAAHIEEEMDTLTALGENDWGGERTGDSGNDKVVIEVVNNSPHEMRFLYVGPDGVHGEIVTDACENCEEYTSPPTGNSCFDDGDRMTVELEPGEYRLLLTSSGSGLFQSRPLHGTVDMDAGYKQESCFYVMSNN
ncbi:DUF1109 domain-containing protein [Nocardiopsis aegyptia]|uniref:DUF1109 domain-containing protein n=1 Tax=Nocardiopsis aegyptia TaxID=220378 RepID=UPI00366E2DDD